MARELLNRVPKRRRVAITRRLLDSRAGGPYIKVRAAYAPLRVEPGVHLVVDGFPRSANSFAMRGLARMLGGAYDVRGHTHAVATLRQAVRLNIPTLLLVRDPDAAVSSFVQMVDGYSLAQAFASYVRFHEALVDIRDDLLIGSFRSATQDLPALVDALNAKYGYAFPKTAHDDEFVATVHRELEETNRMLNAGKVREAGVARPSPLRRRPEEVLADLDPRTERLRMRAQHTFQSFAVSAK